MEDRLKPCPFCGGDNVGIWENRAPASKDFRYSANCYDCHISLGFEKTKEEAIEKWNTRKPMDRIVERLEKVMEYSEKSYKEWGKTGLARMDKLQTKTYKNAIEIVRQVVRMNKVKEMLEALEKELRENKQYRAADKLLPIIEYVTYTNVGKENE